MINQEPGRIQLYFEGKSSTKLAIQSEIVINMHSNVPLKWQTSVLHIIVTIIATI